MVLEKDLIFDRLPLNQDITVKCYLRLRSALSKFS